MHVRRVGLSVIYITVSFTLYNIYNIIYPYCIQYTVYCIYHAIVPVIKRSLLYPNTHAKFLNGTFPLFFRWFSPTWTPTQKLKNPGSQPSYRIFKITDWLWFSYCYKYILYIPLVSISEQNPRLNPKSFIFGPFFIGLTSMNKKGAREEGRNRYWTWLDHVRFRSQPKKY